MLTTRMLSGFQSDRTLPPSSGSVRAAAYQGQALGAFRDARRSVLRVPRQVLDSSHAIAAAAAPMRPGIICRLDPAILSPVFSADEVYRQSSGRPDDNRRLLWHADRARAPLANVERHFMVKR